MNLVVGWPEADPIVGLVITIVILGVLKNAARDIYRRLMDAVDPELVDQVAVVLAGVPGIALGAVVLLLGAVLAATNVLPEGWRGPVMVVVVVGVVLLGVLAVRGWARGNRADAQIAITQGDRSAASNLDKTKTGGSQFASSRGTNSPASNVRE